MRRSEPREGELRVVGELPTQCRARIERGVSAYTESARVTALVALVRAARCSESLQRSVLRRGGVRGALMLCSASRRCSHALQCIAAVLSCSAVRRCSALMLCSASLQCSHALQCIAEVLSCSVVHRCSAVAEVLSYCSYVLQCIAAVPSSESLRCSPYMVSYCCHALPV
jgi:hypothetical protein